MLMEALADKNSRLLELVERWGIIHSQGSEDDGANEGRKYQRCRCCGVIAWDGKAMQHKVKCEVGATLGEKQTIQAAARVYLSTRAPAEEALIEAGREFAASWRAVEYAPGKLADLRDAARALPVEGRAPDASHEKKLGKKGAKP